MIRKYLILIFLASLSYYQIIAQAVDSSSFTLITRQSFYSYENKAEILLHVPPALVKNKLSVTLNLKGGTEVSWSGIAGNKIIRLPFAINLKPGDYYLEAGIRIPASPGKDFRAATHLIILSYKANEVKTDRLTGGLIVNKLPFFPFGFYCYSPVAPTLPEEEAVKGFNLISPYQKIVPETLSERKAYMDRCAQLGMKVHYNLLSVSGGGGVGSKIDGLSDEAKRERLIEEIKTFRDHPALLGWYISDEPNGFKITPALLEEIYSVVKQNDPWHPVSIVFMAPFLSSRKYTNALDIVMADPYPIPNLPVTITGDVTEQLVTEFKGKRPVWIIPQAFGGGELWEREPTIQEIRSMTWQAIIQGATGIQYFVRQGLNYFPKSTATWSECGRMAVEVAELNPWLLSDEERPVIKSSSKNIMVTARIHNGQIAVMAVNTVNEPVSATFTISGAGNNSARVLFENRMLPVKGGILTDHISAFGTEVYLINTVSATKTKEIISKNLIKDGGFEDLTSPGLPSACYARPGGDRGATYFLDTREKTEGNHSLRLVTPEADKSLGIRFFPVTLRAGASYSISVWAKSDPEQRISVLPNDSEERLTTQEEMPQYVEVLMGQFARARFVPDDKWREYITFVTIPKDTLERIKTNLILKMPGQGIAWFDEVKVTEGK